MTLGEERVRIDFNPTGTQAVDSIKRMTADVIDYVNTLPDGSFGSGETSRLKELATLYYELACMLAVKIVPVKRG